MSDLPEVARALWPSDVVAKMDLDAADAAYLINVGLPTEIDWGVDLDPPAPGTEPERFDGMTVLVYDCGTPLCIDHTKGGAIITYEPRRYVNSSVRQFGAFLALYEDFLVRVRRLDDDDELAREDLVNETVARMRKVDPATMRDEESFWAVIMEAARDGF